MPKQLGKYLRVATFKSFLVKSGLRFALGPLVSSEMDFQKFQNSKKKISPYEIIFFFPIFFLNSCENLQVRPQRTSFNPQLIFTF